MSPLVNEEAEHVPGGFTEPGGLEPRRCGLPRTLVIRSGGLKPGSLGMGCRLAVPVYLGESECSAVPAKVQDAERKHPRLPLPETEGGRPGQRPSPSRWGLWKPQGRADSLGIATGE